MSKNKYPTNYLKHRREILKYTQLEVAKAIGVSVRTIQGFESRGELPEVHFEKLAQVLDVTVTDLYVEKYAAIIGAIFCLPTDKFRRFIWDNVGSINDSGLQTPLVSKRKQRQMECNDPEFKRLPKSHKQVIRSVRSMTPAQGFRSLIKLGIYTPDGQLTPEYGGPPRKK